MFEALGEKLQAALADVRRHGTLTEADVDAAMREIRLALLEADVNFKVVRQFTTEVKERCVGAELIGSLNPGQQVVKIVSDELTELMGGRIGESIEFYYLDTAPIVKFILESGSGHAIDLEPTYVYP